MLGGFVFNLTVTPDTSAIELAKTLFELGLWFAVPVFLLVMVLRARRLALVMLIVVMAFAVTYVPGFLPRSPEVDSDAPRLTVMTFNTKMTSEGLVEAILIADADVVALQELSLAGASVLVDLEDEYPYQALHAQPVPYKGQGILSRFPIEADEYWEYPEVPFTLGHQRVEVTFNEQIIVIYNTHPWPPLGWESGYNDESHHVVLEDIAERTFAEELPLILAGDFNMTDNFGEYDLLASQFTDSFLHAGDGIGYTYPNYKYEPLPSFLRLDYIWHSNQFESVESHVQQQNGGSDHSPVITVLALTQPIATGEGD